MNPVIINFEARTGLGPVAASRLIGTSYRTYAQYKSGLRELPLYHQNHVQALLLLAPGVLRELIEEHVHGVV